MKYSIVDKYDVLNESDAKRIDAEFFTPDILSTLNLVRKHKYDKIGNLVRILTDYHANGSYEILREHVQMSKIKNYSLMVRTVDLEENNYENDVMYISKEAYEFLTKTKVYGYEVIVNKIGNAGRTYLMPKLNMPVSLGMNIFMLKFDSNIFNAYAYVYLNTKYGKNIIERRITGAVPLSIDKESVREVIIPLYSNDFYNLIYTIINEKFKLSEQSDVLYKETENLLSKELNLINWQPKHKLSYIKNCSDVQIANRFDAEYFQPKYDEIINTIKKYSNGYDTLRDIVDIKKCIEVGSEEYQENGIPFVRVSNLNKYEINENNQQYISGKKYEELKKEYQPQKGEILLSKDGTAGIAFYINDNPKKMIPSGGILRLTMKNSEYLPEYLTLVLNSVLVQQQIERTSSGALIQHWLIDEINNTIIPKLEKQKQHEIVQKIQESFNCRKQSKQLLEIAKRGVEIAIEEDENIATNWINNELQKIGIEM